MSSLSLRDRTQGRLWSLSCVVLLFCTLLTPGWAQLNNETSPTSQFKSRPDLHPPIIDFTILRPELVTPGYIFTAPYRNIDPGPYIYDNAGQLVWSGAGSSGPKTAHTPRVCQYKGEDHLCYFQGEQHQGFARGHGVIMNKHYQIVKTVESSGAGASSDMHEFKMTPYTNGTTALMTVYQPRQYDLTTNPRFNVRNGLGWIVEGVFQEVDIETGRVLFEWRSLDHVDPGLSWTMPGTTDTSGDGLHEQSPWDYFHINSIDKNEEGDYLISARHVSAIYKLSGKDGSILWQMGGNKPSFEQTNFQFGYQHHARWLHENETHTVLSFYDNASNGVWNKTGDWSHGWIISIDHVANTATMIKEWGAPEVQGGIAAGSQGNLQLLANGGAFIGWGDHPWFSEHLPTGEAVMYGKMAERASNVMVYRSNKYNWTAQPLTKPSLFTYSKTGDEKSGLRLWTSWNGATEVKSWNFYTGDSNSGPFTLAGNASKTGFETYFHTPRFSAWAYTEALDKDGKPLERSVIQRTFVPSPSLVDFCTDVGCQYSERIEFNTTDWTPYEADVQVDEHYLSPNRGFNTSAYYEESPAQLVKPTTHVSGKPGKGSSDHKGQANSGHDDDDYDEDDDNDIMGVIAVPLFLLALIAVFMAAAWAWQSGSLEPVTSALKEQTLGLADGVSKSAVFAGGMLGKYSRVVDDDDDDDVEEEKQQQQQQKQKQQQSRGQSRSRSRGGNGGGGPGSDGDV